MDSIALLVTVVTAAASAEPDAAHPNIVLIISDDQGWTDYGFMGHPVVRTPHLDRLAAQSVLFRRGYVPTALCRPSLMTLVTGHYAHQHGVTGNDPSPRGIPRSSPEYRERRAALISRIDQLPTLPQLLGARGYLSHQSGKWWEGGYLRGGFTHGMTRGFPHPGGRHGDEGLTIGRQGLEPIEHFLQEAKQQDRPFFLWYAPFLPHTPHNPPPRLLQAYQQPDRPEPVARYYAMCEWFDETCGQLLAGLEAQGLRDNTLIVYVTDNGWIQNPGGNGYAPRSKQTAYEGGVRTPILFCWPGRLSPADRPELVSSLDLVPTILAAAGAERPADLPGLNLLELLADGRPLDRHAVFGEGFAHDIADLEDPEASLLYRWCIDDSATRRDRAGPIWKLLLTYDGQVNRYASTHPRAELRPQLFDLQRDPYEVQNVAADHPDVVSRLVRQIEDWYPVTRRNVVTRW
jgi:uncharacterized sulfatase